MPRLFINMIFSSLLLGILPAHADEPKLEIIAEMQERPGNVAVAMDGRVFVTMHPVDPHKCKLYEIQKGGKAVPYPSEEISCGEPDEDGTGIYNALGIRSTVRYILTVLDMGNKDVAPRILVITHNDNQVKAVHEIDKGALTDQSFLQDLGLNWTSNVMYVADMGQAGVMEDKDVDAKPAFLVLFPNPMREPIRRLMRHQTLQPYLPMQAEGKDLLKMRNGKTEQVKLALNPMTIDVPRNWLYYGTMSGGKIYRVPLDKMEDPKTYPDDVLPKYIEAYADKPPTDGMTIDAEGNLYLANVRDNEIGIIDAKTRKYRTYLKDPRILWPDGMSFGPDGMIYLTINQLNRAAKFNLGKEEGKPPYYVARFKPLVAGSVGR